MLCVVLLQQLQLLITLEECEAVSLFTEAELNTMSRDDILGVVSHIGDLIWENYKKLTEHVTDALQI